MGKWNKANNSCGIVLGNLLEEKMNTTYKQLIPLDRQSLDPPENEFPNAMVYCVAPLYVLTL